MMTSPVVLFPAAHRYSLKERRNYILVMLKSIGFNLEKKKEKKRKSERHNMAII